MGHSHCRSVRPDVQCQIEAVVAGRAKQFFRTEGAARGGQITVLGAGSLQVTRKRTMRRHHSLWRLVGKTPTPPQRVEIYLAQQLADGQVMADMLAIRLPRKSRCVAVLDQVLADQELTPTQTPGTSVSPDQPDRG